MKSAIRRKEGFYVDLLAGAVDPVPLAKTSFLKGLTRIVSTLTSSVKLRFAVPSTDGKHEYKVRVKFQKGDDRKGNPAIKVGRVLVPIDLDSVSVHCTCPDFRFTYHDWLKENGHAAGWFKPVESAGKGKVVRAVKHAGCCKHVSGVLAATEANVVVKM